MQLKIFLHWPILLALCTTFVVVMALDWKEISKMVATSMKFTSCLEILSISETDFGKIKEEDELTKIMDNRKRELTNGKVEKEYRKGAEENLESAKTRLANFLTIRDILDLAKEDSVENNWQILGLKKNTKWQDKRQKDVEEMGEKLSKKIEEWEQDGGEKELPVDKILEARKAIKEIGNSMKKLANYLELQASMKKKPDTRANCMEILLMNPDTLEKFTEDDLADARNEVLRKSAKMPKKIGGGVTMGTLKSNVNEAFMKLRNYLKIREQLNAKGDGEKLRDVLTILGFDPEMDEDEVEEAMIGKRAASKLPKKEELPSDIAIEGLERKIRDAEDRLKNFLAVKKIIREAGENTLESNWNILGAKRTKQNEENLKTIVEEKMADINKWMKKMPKDKEKQAEKAKEEIENANTRLSNYIWLRDLAIRKTKDDNVKTHMNILGGTEMSQNDLEPKKIDDLLRKQKEKLEKKRKEVPTDADGLAEMVEIQLEESAKKLKNYIDLRKMMDINGDNVEALMKVIGIAGNGQMKGDFDMDELDTAKQVALKKVANAPNDEGGGWLARTKKRIKEAYKKLANYLPLRKGHLAKAGETLKDDLAILGIDITEKTEENFSPDDIQQAMEQQQQQMPNPMDLPSDLKGMAKKIQEAFNRLSNFLILREINDKALANTVRDNLEILGKNGRIQEEGERSENNLDWDKLAKAKAEIIGRFKAKKDLPGGEKAETAAKSAIQNINNSAVKLRNYYWLKELTNANKDDRLERHLANLGFGQKEKAKMDKEQIDEKFKDQMKTLGEIVEKGKLPEEAGIQEMMGNAKKILEDSVTKLKNFADLQPILAINGETIADLIGILLLKKESVADLDEKKPGEAKNAILKKAEKMPQGYQEKISAKVEKAANKLEAFMKVREKHKNTGKTLEDNLAMLGMKMGNKLDELKQEDIDRAMENMGTMPADGELPSDVRGITKKIADAKKRLENYAIIIGIGKKAKANSLKDNLEIIGMEELAEQDDEMMTIDELSKRAKFRVEMIEKWKKRGELPEEEGKKEKLIETAIQEVKTAVTRLANYFWAKKIVEPEDDQLKTHMAIMGFGKQIKATEMEKEEIQKAKEKQKELAQKNLLNGPKEYNDEMMKKVEKQIEKTSTKLANFVMARNIAAIRENMLKVHLKALGWDEDWAKETDKEKELKKRAETQLKLLDDPDEFPEDVEYLLERAKKRLANSVKKLECFLMAQKINSLKGNNMEDYLQILGFSPTEIPDADDKSAVVTKAKERKEEFARDFPKDVEDEAKRAREQIGRAEVKLLDFVKLRGIAEIKGKNVADLLRIMMIEDKEGTEKKGKMKRMLEKVKKEELAKAEENVRKAVKEMPNWKEKDKIEKKIGESFGNARKLLENYLALWERNLLMLKEEEEEEEGQQQEQQKNTLKDNLARLGMANNLGYDGKELEMAKEETIKWIAKLELPEDADGKEEINERVKKAAKKLENALMAKEINKIGGEKEEDKWKIVGIMEVGKRGNAEELTKEYKKRKELLLKEVPNDVVKEAKKAMEKMKAAYKELKENLEKVGKKKDEEDVIMRTRKQIEEEEKKKKIKEAEEAEKKRTQKRKDEEEERDKKQGKAIMIEGRAPIIDANCADTSPYCRFQILLCKNPYYMADMQQSCRRSCGVCVPSDGQFQCQDNNENCQFWEREAAFCRSQIYSKGMKLEQCAKTCALCPI